MKKILLTLTVVVAIAVVIGLYFYYKKPADVREEKADIELTAVKLAEDYEDETKGDSLYVGKVLAVTGDVADIEEHEGNWSVLLDTGNPMSDVICSFYPEEAAAVKDLKKGETVTIKGQCTGNLAGIVLNHCSIVKTP